MKVFWVLFLVLLNTIGNQGDPNHGLKNFETGPKGLPLNIVSMRNYENSHICTGSIISREFILSSKSCNGTTHVLHGLREYQNCSETEMGIKVNVVKQTNTAILFQVAVMFNTTVEKLYMPRNSRSALPRTGAVLGWSFDVEKNQFVMEKIDGVNITKAFSGHDETFYRQFRGISTGSPLIDKDVIYGFISNDADRFSKFLPDVGEIRGISKITS